MLPTIIHGPTVITPTTHRIKRGQQHSMWRDHASGLDCLTTLHRGCWLLSMA